MPLVNTPNDMSAGVIGVHGSNKHDVDLVGDGKGSAKVVALRIDCNRI